MHDLADDWWCESDCLTGTSCEHPTLTDCPQSADLSQKGTPNQYLNAALLRLFFLNWSFCAAACALRRGFMM